MEIHGIYFITVAICLFYTKPTIGKKLFKRNSISRNDEEWDDAAESFGRVNSVKRQQPFDESRRANKAGEFEDARDEPMESYDKRNKKRSPFGIVYSGGQPIGVIEPIFQSYQFKNFDDTNHNYKKRNLDAMLENDELIPLNENKANLHGGKYAAVLANFKIDNRLKSDAYKNDDAVSIEKRREKNRIIKRDPMETESPAKDLSKPVNFIPTRMTKAKRETVDLEKIEENIINVMDNLGLTQKEGSKKEQKRNVVNPMLQKDREKRDYNEDEDLENGDNKIIMTKENLDRTKKDYIFPKAEKVHNVKDGQITAGVKNRRSRSPKIMNYQHEGEEFIRQRRHDSNSGTIVKDLETSGDLTVSGNKSPLVSVNSEQNYSDNKRGIDEVNSDVQKNNNDHEYERMLEKNIQDKISAIKSDVKREIYNLKETERKKRNVDIMENENLEDKVKASMKRQLDDVNEFKQKEINGIENSQHVNEKRETNPIEAEEFKEDKRRMSRPDVDDNLTDKVNHVENNQDTAEIPRKRDSNSYEDDEESVDVSVESNSANDVIKRSDELHLANNSLPTVQISQTPNVSNVPNAGNVQPLQGSPAAVGQIIQPLNQPQQQQQQQQPPPQLQQQPQLQQPPQVLNQQPQQQQQLGSDQNVSNNFVPNGVPQVNYAIPIGQTYSAPPVGKQTQFNGTVNQGFQGTAEAQKQQPHQFQDVNNVSTNFKPTNNVGVNKPIRRQNLNEYDDDGFEEKVDEVRSTDLESEDDGSVKFEKNIDESDNMDEEEDGENDKKLVRPERFLQNITEDELRNLENENPSLEQRKRREAANYQYDQYADEDYTNDNDDLMIHKRTKRAHYDTFDANDDMYSNIANDDYEEPLEKQRIYRKRNLDFNHDYELENPNNYYNKEKRQRRNNNDPNNYLDNSDEESFDGASDYYTSEDYRRRKRQALKSAAVYPDGAPITNHNMKHPKERNIRKKRLGSKINRKSAKEINMEALSNSELFGGLPQTFQGELSRFKRVKRSNDY